MSLPTKGDRIRLVHCDDPHTRLSMGSEGTVTGIGTIPDGLNGKTYSTAQIHVRWDDGSALSLLEGEDIWEVIT